MALDAPDLSGGGIVLPPGQPAPRSAGHADDEREEWVTDIQRAVWFTATLPPRPVNYDEYEDRLILFDRVEVEPSIPAHLCGRGYTMRPVSVRLD